MVSSNTPEYLEVNIVVPEKYQLTQLLSMILQNKSRYDLDFQVSTLNSLDMEKHEAIPSN